jgi:protoheme IX farnesyltransferase
MSASVDIVSKTESVTERSLTAIMLDLIKARLTFLVLLTTLVGFYLGSPSPTSFLLMFHTVLGTALVAAGAAALNQLMERKLDARMKRTASRPIPAGHLKPETVAVFGSFISIAGLVYLALFVNLLTAALGALTIGSYLFLYTPLKQLTTLNTAIGAIPGALPPLMGWTAATGEVSIGGWSLFAILFWWQLPHFLAIAWLYREDYAKAGFMMLPVVDTDGQRTGRQAVAHTIGLIPVSFTPFIFKLVGPVYFFGALILGIIFLACAVDFSRKLNAASARRLFLVSIIYLPLLMLLIVLGKLK